MGSLRKKPSGKWEVRFVDPYGKLRARSFIRKTDAVAYERRVETEKTQGLWIDPRLGQTRFGEFADAWLSMTVHLKPATQVSYEMLLRRYLKPTFGTVPLAKIDRSGIQAWLSQLQASGKGPGTVRNAYRVLARILGEAERGGLIARNPASRIPLPRSVRTEMEFLSPSQIRLLSETIPPRYKSLILMAGFTGLRFGELVALRVDRLDLLKGTVQVVESATEAGGELQIVPTKSGERRSVPLPRFLCEALATHLAEFPATGGRVFSSPEGEVLRTHFGRRIYKPAVRAAGLSSNLRFHDLRHSAASIAIATGANVKQVQQMLGHASATVTLDTYAHILPSLTDQLRSDLDLAYRSAETDSELVSGWSDRSHSVSRMPKQGTV